MRTVKEINEQLHKEYDCIARLYVNIERLEKELKAAKEEELKAYVDKWLNEKFGIKNQIEARNKSIFIVFDEEANFVKTVATGYGEEFHYVSSTEDEDRDSLEYWLKKNKLYAHRLSSFCDRNYDWYQKSFREQLEYLCWEFDKNGKLSKTQW